MLVRSPAGFAPRSRSRPINPRTRGQRPTGWRSREGAEKYSASDSMVVQPVLAELRFRISHFAFPQGEASSSVVTTLWRRISNLSLSCVGSKECRRPSPTYSFPSNRHCPDSFALAKRSVRCARNRRSEPFGANELVEEIVWMTPAASCAVIPARMSKPAFIFAHCEERSQTQQFVDSDQGVERRFRDPYSP